jgi:positive regulator of sigma E activity
MFPPVLIGIAAFYIALGVVVVRKVRKPTCRVCLLRKSCPNRNLEYADPARKQCWSCGQVISAIQSTPDIKS